MRENHSRSIAKAISWRVIATLTTAIIVFIYTGNLTLSIGIGSVEIVAKIILNYFHERAWNTISWGYNQ
jgi:uncharacterized membrane protein|tara:strand:- start:10797 stop:11003 length:207 start_codon:yes stop_codon:yes gene_type:complete